MKDKVLTIGEDLRVYTLDELDYKGKKYVFAVEIDENDEPIETNTYSLEINISGDELIAKEIDDFEVASVVNNLFIAKLANNE